MLSTWMNMRRHSRAASRKQLGRATSFRPQLEPLENRWVPATLTVGPSDAYHTIMAAVNAASSGDIINVNNGTYQEQVIIPPKGADNRPITSLQLKSVNQFGAIIQAPATMTDTQAIVDVNGATGVTISKFKITGQTSGAFELAGVLVETNGSATITGNWITGLQTDNEAGVGVLVGNTKYRLNNLTGTKGTATVSGNTIDNYGKAGVAVVNGSTGTVNGNTITGSGVGSPVLQYGVEIGSFQNGDGAGGSITNNTITGNLAEAGPFVSGGILIFNAGNVTQISNNNLGANAGALPDGVSVPFSNDIGIWIFDLSNCTISNNGIYETKYDGILIAKLNTGSSKLKVSNNATDYGLGDGLVIESVTASTFSNNDASHNGQSGIWLASADMNNTIKQNTSTFNGTFGILVADFDPNNPSFEAYLPSSTSSGNTISQNTVTQNNQLQLIAVFDAEDFSLGSGTAGTGNTWSANTLGTTSPTGLH